MNAFRLPALVVIVALLAGTLVIDQARSEPELTELAIRLPGASVAPDDALSSTWFCAASTASPDGLADSEVVLANTLLTTSTAAVSVFRGSLEPTIGAEVTEISLDLPPQSTTSLRLGDLAPDADVVSLAVEIDSGGVLVDKISSGPTGVARTACAADASTEWVVTSGSTVPGSRLQLVIFNPFPDDAVVDVDFVSEVGARRPEDLVALHVPARSSRRIEVGDVVAASESITSFVRARSGRVVAEGIQSFDGSSSPLGLSVITGAPATAASWFFAGVSPAAGPARLTIVNPSESEVRVDVEVYPAGAERFVEPFEVILQPGQSDVVELLSAGRLAGISSFSLVARSLDGPRIIAGMEQRPAVAEPDPLSALVELEVDAPSTGFAASIGQAVLATRLFTTVEIAADDERSALHVFNPADDTFVRVRTSVAIDGASRDEQFEVGPQRTTRIPLGELGTGRYSLILEASGPIVATREITGLSSRSWAPLLPGAEASTINPS
jgi:hypothetical protein